MTNSRLWPKFHGPSKFTALLAAFVAIVMLAVSLTHLSAGIAKTTGDNTILSWCAAIGIDMGIVVLKMATVVCSARPVWKTLGGTVNFGLVVVLLMSAGMNIRSYTEGQEVNTLNFWIGVAFGLFVPYIIWLMSQVSAKCWIEGHKKIAAAPKAKRGRPKKVK